jgi:predicted RNA-binding Zn-ribbon protein involved in translation (DUF1610 family)
MTEHEERRNENSTVEEADHGEWIKLEFTCPECGSHEVMKCLGGQVVYAVVDSIA